MTVAFLPNPEVIADLRTRFEKDGFCVTPPIVPQDLIDRVIPRMDRVVQGDYETGEPPYDIHFTPEDGPEKLRKVDQPQFCDNTILELVSTPELGNWAAAILGANRIQAWAIQLLMKPPGSSDQGRVGWHQDSRYWPFWEGEVFTAWVALSEVQEDSGPVRYVVGSNQWGPIEGGDFFGSDDNRQTSRIAIPEGAEWREESALMSPGQVVFHHKHTFHGSGPNLSDRTRLSFAIHLRTENSKPIALGPEIDCYYTENLDDPRKAPILYGA